jgi:hypothetical protein
MLHQDTSIGLSEIFCEEILKSHWWLEKLSQQALFLQEGIVDNITRSSVISFLSYLFGGMQQFFYHPSIAPVHQHSINETSNFRRERKLSMKTMHEKNQDISFSLRLFSKCRSTIEMLMEPLCDTIYKSRREDLLPSGDDGRCYLSRVARFLTVMADYDDLMIW